MTFLAFILVGGCLAVALFLNSMLDKRAEKRRRTVRPPRRH